MIKEDAAHNRFLQRHRVPLFQRRLRPTVLPFPAQEEELGNNRCGERGEEGDTRRAHLQSHPKKSTGEHKKSHTHQVCTGLGRALREVELEKTSD